MERFTRKNPPPGFYTYAYLRQSNGTPWYIGKGFGDRAWKKHGSDNYRWSPPPNERILFLKWDLNEEEAFAHEIYLIGVYGLERDGGILAGNQTYGGEGASGYVQPRDVVESKASVQRTINRAQTTAERWFAATDRQRASYLMYESKNLGFSFDDWMAGLRVERDYSQQVQVLRRTQALKAQEQYGVDPEEWLQKPRNERLAAMAWINNHPGSNYQDYVNRVDPHGTAASSLNRMRKGAERNNVPFNVWSKLSERARKVIPRRIARGWTVEEALVGLA